MTRATTRRNKCTEHTIRNKMGDSDPGDKNREGHQEGYGKQTCSSGQRKKIIRGVHDFKRSSQNMVEGDVNLEDKRA